MPTYIDCVGPDGQHARMTERQLDRVYRTLGWRPEATDPEPEPDGSVDTDDDVVEGA